MREFGAGSSPVKEFREAVMDVRVVIHPGIYTIEPLSNTAERWMAQHLPDDSEDFGHCFYIKARDMPPVLKDMEKDGLQVHVMI
jgi:hypothetical protein